jgi:Ni,Fe-hydrogenase III small subunit
MFEFLRTLAAQRGKTSSFPKEVPQFPERFRGRPKIEGEGSPVLDLGACLFSPEEASEIDESKVRYTHDHRMATNTREGLVTATGELELAHALSGQMQSILGRSLRLRSVVAGSCGGCELEMAALSNVVFDMARFGVQFVASPRHADGIVISGVVNANMVEALERTYAAVPDPKIVIAIGACAASGGPFRGSSAIVGVPPSIHVDLWIPGCPSHPLTILDGLLRLVGRIGKE